MSCNNGESKSETPVTITWEWHKYLNLQLQQPTHTHSHKHAHTHHCHHRRSLWESMTVFFVKSSACGSYVMEAEFSPTYFGAVLTWESGCKFRSCWSLFYDFFLLAEQRGKKVPFHGALHLLAQLSFRGACSEPYVIGISTSSGAKGAFINLLWESRGAPMQPSGTKSS